MVTHGNLHGIEQIRGATSLLPPTTFITNNPVRRNAAILAILGLTAADTLYESISTQKTAT